MSKIDDEKKQINDIVSVVKLTSLLFSGMGFFKFIFNYYKIPLDNSSYTLTMGIIVILVFVLSLVYSIWAFSTTKKFNEKYIARIQLIENLLFVLLFLTIIIITNAQKSDF